MFIIHKCNFTYRSEKEMEKKGLDLFSSSYSSTFRAIIYIRFLSMLPRNLLTFDCKSLTKSSWNSFWISDQVFMKLIMKSCCSMDSMILLIYFILHLCFFSSQWRALPTNPETNQSSAIIDNQEQTTDPTSFSKRGQVFKVR